MPDHVGKRCLSCCRSGVRSRARRLSPQPSLPLLMLASQATQLESSLVESSRVEPSRVESPALCRWVGRPGDQRCGPTLPVEAVVRMRLDSSSDLFASLGTIRYDSIRLGMGQIRLSRLRLGLSGTAKGSACAALKTDPRGSPPAVLTTRPRFATVCACADAAHRPVTEPESASSG